MTLQTNSGPCNRFFFFSLYWCMSSFFALQVPELKRDLYLYSVYLVFENFITVSFHHYLSIYILRQSCGSRMVIVPCFYPSFFGQFCGWGLITKEPVHSTKCLSASLLFSVLAYYFEKRKKYSLWFKNLIKWPRRKQQVAYLDELHNPNGRKYL